MTLNDFDKLELREIEMGNENKTVNESLNSQNMTKFLREDDSIVPHYTSDEVERAIEIFRLLIKVRDRSREKGLIDW